MSFDMDLKSGQHVITNVTCKIPLGPLVLVYLYNRNKNKVYVIKQFN